MWIEFDKKLTDLIAFGVLNFLFLPSDLVLTFSQFWSWTHQFVFMVGQSGVFHLQYSNCLFHLIPGIVQAIHLSDQFGLTGEKIPENNSISRYTRMVFHNILVRSFHSFDLSLIGLLSKQFFRKNRSTKRRLLLRVFGYGHLYSFCRWKRCTNMDNTSKFMLTTCMAIVDHHLRVKITWIPAGSLSQCVSSAWLPITTLCTLYARQR